MSAQELRFATFPSPLAQSQAQAMVAALSEAVPTVAWQLDVVPSPAPPAGKNDEIFMALSRHEIDHLEQLVLDGTCDLVVVEAVDVVLPLPDGLVVACVPDRSTPFEAYLNRQGLIMDEMDPGSRIGVLSMRSRCQMAALWPELDFRILPGGLDKAMATQLNTADIDGLVMPAAATEKLGIQGVVAEIFAPEFVLPSPGQGVLAILARSADTAVPETLSPLHSVSTAIEMTAERSFCSRMVSDQDLPVGALAKADDESLTMVGATGACQNRIAVSGRLDEAEAVGLGLAQQILSSGASLADLLEAEFPDGLPDDPDDPELRDEDADILESVHFGPAKGLAAKGLADQGPETDEADTDDLDIDDLEHLRALEDLAGISAEDVRPGGDSGDEDDEDEDSYD